MLGVGKRTKLCREARYVCTFKAVEAVCKGWVRPRNRPTGSCTFISQISYHNTRTSIAIVKLSYIDGSRAVVV